MPCHEQNPNESHFRGCSADLVDCLITTHPAEVPVTGRCPFFMQPDEQQVIWSRINITQNYFLVVCCLINLFWLFVVLATFLSKMFIDSAHWVSYTFSRSVNELQVDYLHIVLPRRHYREAVYAVDDPSPCSCDHPGAFAAHSFLSGHECNKSQV